MKFKLLIKVLAIFLCFFIVDSVDASSCTTKELNSLKQLASNIKFSYQLYDDTYNENHKYYFEILVTNFTNKFYFVDFYGREFRYMENLEKEGIRELGVIDEGLLYEVDVYTTNETSCPDTKVVTKKIEIPYYNDYSRREECVGIEEFSLCQKYYGGYIESEEYFLEKVNEYKNGNLEDVQNKDKGIIEQIINFISNNLLVVIPVSLVAVTTITIIVIRVIKSRKRTKIKI